MSAIRTSQAAVQGCRARAPRRLRMSPAPAFRPPPVRSRVPSLAEQRVELLARGGCEFPAGSRWLDQAHLLEQRPKHRVELARRTIGAVADQAQRAATVEDGAHD